jgi:hypothetical protein
MTRGLLLFTALRSHKQRFRKGGIMVSDKIGLGEMRAQMLDQMVWGNDEERRLAANVLFLINATEKAAEVIWAALPYLSEASAIAAANPGQRSVFFELRDALEPFDFTA